MCTEKKSCQGKKNESSFANNTFNLLNPYHHCLAFCCYYTVVPFDFWAAIQTDQVLDGPTVDDFQSDLN